MCNRIACMFRERSNFLKKLQAKFPLFWKESRKRYEFNFLFIFDHVASMIRERGDSLNLYFTALHVWFASEVFSSTTLMWSGRLTRQNLCTTLSWERPVRLGSLIDASMVRSIWPSLVHILWWDWTVRLGISIKFPHEIVRNIWQEANVSVRFPLFELY